MRNATVTAVLDAPERKVFDYLADIGNLPEWATEFAREVRREGEDYKVVNGLGEFYFEIHADRSSGVIDMYAGPSKEAMAVFPTRTISLPDGRTAFSFTMFQAPDMPDELFESRRESLNREFANIEQRFSAERPNGTACVAAAVSAPSVLCHSRCADGDEAARRKGADGHGRDAGHRPRHRGTPRR